MRRLRYLVIGAQALGVPFSLVLLASMLCPAGCGPIQYLSQVSDKATKAVAAAKQAHAEQLAPYEFTAANEYLHKAREEGGTAEYQVAIEYGRKAEDLALRARAIAEAKSQTKSEAKSEAKSEPKAGPNSGAIVGAPSGGRVGGGAAAEPSGGAGDSP